MYHIHTDAWVIQNNTTDRSIAMIDAYLRLHNNAVVPFRVNGTVVLPPSFTCRWAVGRVRVLIYIAQKM